MRFRLIIISILMLSLIRSEAQVPAELTPDKEGSLVKWMTLKEALEKNKANPRPMIIDFYTDWCGWCKVMMKNTYSNPDLATYINTNFYPVKFDAETKDTVIYDDEKFGPTGKEKRDPNAFAVKMLGGKMMYPTTLFMNKSFNFSMLAQGYLETNKLEPMLVFTLEAAFRTCSFDDFKVQFEKAFYDSTNTEKNKKVNWLQPVKVFNGDTKSKKKTIVFLHTEWCNTCRVMYRTSFSDSLTQQYLEEKFNLVDFDPQIKDTLTYNGTKYYNLQSQASPFHQLISAINKNTFALPEIIILDEDFKTLDAIPSYIHPKLLSDIAHYYGENIFKVKPWADYIKKDDEKQGPLTK